MRKEWREREMRGRLGSNNLRRRRRVRRLRLPNPASFSRKLAGRVTFYCHGSPAINATACACPMRKLTAGPGRLWLADEGASPAN